MSANRPRGGEDETPVKIASLDHLVITVTDMDATIAFYRDALGMIPKSVAGRQALHFGGQKINLHLAGHEFEPKAKRVTLGSADLCFILETPVERAVSHLQRLGIPIEEGPVERTGATGKLLSIYLRDPDGNLIELSNIV